MIPAPRSTVSGKHSVITCEVTGAGQSGVHLPGHYKVRLMST